MLNMDDVTEFVGNVIGTIFGSRSGKILKRLVPNVQKINEFEAEMAKLTDAQMIEKTKAFREAIEKLRAKDPKADENGTIEAFLDGILPAAFALVRESGKRVLGMRHFDVQMVGGMVLHKNSIAEMITGEGKTLVATLPSYLNALPRRPHEYAYVHVVTVNDYLANRDATWNSPLFSLLGMTCLAIQSDMDSWERHPVYASDIVYGTNSEFGFDYLRDNMKMEAEKQVQKVRHFAIIDEVDSILIDEARTPLIISGSPDDEVTERYELAAKLASHLVPVPDEEKDRIEAMRLEKIFEEPERGHYMVDEKDHTVTLTARGIDESERYLGIDNFYAGKHMEWPHFIDNALKAKELYKKEVKYVVAPGQEGNMEVLIVDEFTGRMMHGRRWSDGLHQAVEAKEKLAGERINMEAESMTLATITIQNFFRLYKKLSGMTGTAMTEAGEFGKTYKLEVAAIPTNRPMQRQNHPDVIFGSEREKWNSIAEEIQKYHQAGRPVLVGTTSVEKSERLAGILERKGFRDKFSVLNAKQHEKEAGIVDRAGELGAITVATNMAGRGTDIVLRPVNLEQQIKHWQSLDMAPKNFDLDRPKEELEEHLYGFWAKKFLDGAAFKDSDPKERRKAVEKFWAENDYPPLQIAENVRDLGGLHIIGSERHEARRIDNQLRGRSGRQGDPGSSRFFLCLDDDLMRIFAKDWVRDFLRKSGMKDGVPLESKMVSRSIEKAQRRVEEHHMGTRKRLLEYDEVMNEQRKLIYGIRDKVLRYDELKETMTAWIEDVIALAVQREAGIVDPPPLEAINDLVLWMRRKFDVEVAVDNLEGRRVADIEDLLIKKVADAYDAKESGLDEITIPQTKLISYTPEELALPGDKRFEMVKEKASFLAKVPVSRFEDAEGSMLDGEIMVPKEGDGAVYLDAKAIATGKMPTVIICPMKIKKMRLAERFIMLDVIDTKWKDHLHNMDVLRDGIHLRGYAQKDPKLEYKREGFDLFYEMFNSMKDQAADLILKIEIGEKIENQELSDVYHLENAQASHDDAASAFDAGGVQAGAQGGGSAEMEAQSEHGGADIQAVSQIRRTERKVNPNETCPCGSGKKFKKCCGRYGGGQSIMPSGPSPENPGKVRVGG